MFRHRKSPVGAQWPACFEVPWTPSVVPSFLICAHSAAPLCRSFPLRQFARSAGLSSPSYPALPAPAAATLSPSPASALCRACRLAPPPFVRAVAYGLYEEPMRGALHAFKYGGLHSVARNLGEMLAQAIAKLAPEAPAELLVVPVPLHRSRLAMRGFNQARLLSLHALKSLRNSHPAWKLILASTTLMRLRETESQAGLTPRQRRINVRGAFIVSDPATVTGRHVLLVDDILTTGATARAASQALLKAGAASVWVATLARARRSNPFAHEFISEDERDEFGAELIRASTTLQGSYGTSSHDQPSF